MGASITVVYFAAARELAGCARETVPLPGPSADATQLRHVLGERHAALARYLPRMRFALNGELGGDELCARAGDELAVLPPVAGGSGVALCEMRAGALSVDEVLRAVSGPGMGGVALFVGVVRDHAEGKPVARLDYEAHPTLAQSEMARVLSEVVTEHPEVRVAALHRQGQLAVGELAVVVAAASAHRAPAFEACRAAIERIKERVPIWKKEWAPDGSANWVNLEP